MMHTDFSVPNKTAIHKFCTNGTPCSALQSDITSPLPSLFLSCCVFNNMFHRDQATHLQVQGRMDREFLSPKMPEQAVGRRVLLRQQTFALLPGVTVYQRQTRRVLHRQRDRRPNLLSDGTLHQQAECRRVLLRKWIQCRLRGCTVYQCQKWPVLHWKRTKRPNLLSDGTLHEQTEGRATLYFERGHVIDWMQDWWCVCVVQRVDLFTAHARMYDTIFARNNCNHTVM